jgi:mono/diheme cytochrome c family protein
MFLKITYVVLLLWGGYYTFTAQKIDDRAAVAAKPTAEQGQALVQQRCSGCHSLGTNKVYGPGLKGVGGRLKPEEIRKILHEGRGQMPAPPSLGLTEDDLKSIQLFLESNK